MTPRQHTIVVHPYFKDPILLGIKCAFMTQANFYHVRPTIVPHEQGEPLVAGDWLRFDAREETNPPREVPFATAVVRNAAILDVDSTKEHIRRQVNISGQFVWIDLKPEEIRKLIANEGFQHPDDFWNNTWKRKNHTARCTQIYFDTVKPLLSVVTPKPTIS